MFGFVSCLTKTIDKLQIIVDTRNSDLFKSEKLRFYLHKMPQIL